MQIYALLVACVALVSTVSPLPHPDTVTLQTRHIKDFFKDPGFFFDKIGKKHPAEKKIFDQATDKLPPRVSFWSTTKQFPIPTPEQITAAGYRVKETWSGDPTQNRYGEWQILGRLGAGGYGVVLLGYNGEKYAAIKFVDAARAKSDDVLKEVSVQWQLKDVKSVVQVFEYGSEKNDSKHVKEYTIIVMEAADAGDLAHLIEDSKTGIEEPKAKALFSQMATGLRDIHAKGFAVRDIKPGNFLLFKGNNGGLTVKYTDFGFSTRIDSGIFDGRGTLDYTAPEMFTGKKEDAPKKKKSILDIFTPKKKKKDAPYDMVKVDIFALGITLFQMLTNADPPRNIESADGINTKVSKINFEDAPFKKLTPNEFTLVKGMLERDPAARFSVQQILDSAWLKQ